MAGICTSPYPIEKVRDSSYPYSYTINARIPRENGDGIRAGLFAISTYWDRDRTILSFINQHPSNWFLFYFIF